MSIINILIDDSISDELCQLYLDSRQDEFIGDKTTPSLEEIRTKLSRFISTAEGEIERLGILKVFKDDVLIGWSLPRKLLAKEGSYFDVDSANVAYYRLGTNYLKPEHRGQGYMTDVLKWFKAHYVNIVWECSPDNKPSGTVAIKAGLYFTHTVYVLGEGKFRSVGMHGRKPENYLYAKYIYTTYY